MLTAVTIPDFWAGVLATLLVVLLIVVIFVIVAVRKADD